MQIMRTGFDGNWETSLLRIAKFVEGFRCGEMDDVNVRAKFLGELDQEVDGVEFGFVGARSKIGLVVAPVGVGEFFGCARDRACEFGVDEKREAGFLEVGKRGAKFVFVDEGEFFSARVDQEAFVAGVACVGEGEELVVVIADDGTPRSPVD